jgi:GNAT superfamily N-acetyltransferase
MLQRPDSIRETAAFTHKPAAGRRHRPAAGRRRGALPYRDIVLYIRPGSVADVPAVVELFDRAVEWLVANGRSGQWGTVPFSRQPHLVAQISAAAASGAMRVADLVSGTPSGSMWLAEAPAYAPPADRPELYLQGLVARQGHGIGRALLDYAMDEARQRGVAQVRLDCWAGGDQALVRYYESAGFTATTRVTVGSRWPGMILVREVAR